MYTWLHYFLCIFLKFSVGSQKNYKFFWNSPDLVSYIFPQMLKTPEFIWRCKTWCSRKCKWKKKSLNCDFFFFLDWVIFFKVCVHVCVLLCMRSGITSGSVFRVLLLAVLWTVWGTRDWIQISCVQGLTHYTIFPASYSNNSCQRHIFWTDGKRNEQPILIKLTNIMYLSNREVKRIQLHFCNIFPQNV